MHDVLPTDSANWHYVESVLREVLTGYGYRELRIPLLEHTELFKRSIGEATDIVEKEMYTFDDRNGVSLTLRPEATAGVVRAGITNGLLHNQRQKIWTSGAMFRYEKPQKGRLRQFHQFDVEALGLEGPDIDAELIIISQRIWKALGIDAIELELNSLGTPESRSSYRKALTAYFEKFSDQLDTDSQNRLQRNPMRILDSKNPQMQALIEDAPKITEYLDPESASHLSGLRRLLDNAGIAYRLNPRLVRGLDYYTRTVFEWVTDRLGSQGAVCSGGRYDGLVAQLGGKATPAIGWAIGMERLIELYRMSETARAGNDPDIYIVAAGEGVLEPAFEMVEKLRDARPDLKMEMNCGGGSFKTQMKRADKSGAMVAIILGEAEIAEKKVGIKPLREETEQYSAAWAELEDVLTQYVDT